MSQWFKWIFLASNKKELSNARAYLTWKYETTIVQHNKKTFQFNPKVTYAVN